MLMMIFAGVLIVGGLGMLGLIIAADIRASREYNHANRCRGIVVGQREDYTISAYGSGPAGLHKRRYRQYEVEFPVEGQRHRGVIQTKEKGLRPGDSVEVRYIRDKRTHEIVVVTRVFQDRLRELAIGGTLGVIWAAVIICLKITGVI